MSCHCSYNFVILFNFPHTGIWILGIQDLKGTPLRSGPVPHLKIFFFENLFFLLSICVGLSSLSCRTLICILSVGNSLKTLCLLISESVSNAFPCSTDTFQF